eukprot:5695901-Prorocentrum_lima.AAC.1
MIHLPPGLRESLLLTEDSAPELYDIARQAWSTSGLGDEVRAHYAFFNNTVPRVLKLLQTR